jgi:hypothetical protein
MANGVIVAIDDVKLFGFKASSADLWTFCLTLLQIEPVQYHHSAGSPAATVYINLP